MVDQQFFFTESISDRRNDEWVRGDHRVVVSINVLQYKPVSPKYCSKFGTVLIQPCQQIVHDASRKHNRMSTGKIDKLLCWQSRRCLSLSSIDQ